MEKRRYRHRGGTFGRQCRMMIALSLAAALYFAIGGCAGQARQQRALPDISWPPPPEVTRIELVQSVSKPEDLNIRPGILKTLLDYVGGRRKAAIASPHGLTTDARGRLYVVDTLLKGVHVFDAANNQYAFFPPDRRLLPSPVGIAIDSGLIYITDSRRNMVYIFTVKDRKPAGTIGDGIFKRPTGVAVNAKTSELLVVDTLQARVFRFDLETRTAKGWFGGVGATEGAFHYPTHICVTMNGNIAVSDALNFRLQVFSPQGRFMFAVGRMGNGPGSFARPKGVASDSDGNLYVVDGLFDNVQMFSPSGRLLMAFGGHGKGYGDFWLPTAIHIDHNDLIYVSDTSNRRVEVFKYQKKGLAK